MRKKGFHPFQEAKATRVLAEQLVEGPDDGNEAPRTTRIIKLCRPIRSNLQRHQLTRQQAAGEATDRNSNNNLHYPEVIINASKTFLPVTFAIM